MFKPRNEHHAQRAVKPKADSKVVDEKSFLLNPLGCDLDRGEGPSDVMKRASQEMYREDKRCHFLLVCKDLFALPAEVFFSNLVSVIGLGSGVILGIRVGGDSLLVSGL